MKFQRKTKNTKRKTKHSNKNKVRKHSGGSLASDRVMQNLSLDLNDPLQGPRETTVANVDPSTLNLYRIQSGGSSTSNSIVSEGSSCRKQNGGKRKKSKKSKSHKGKGKYKKNRKNNHSKKNNNNNMMGGAGSDWGHTNYSRLVGVPGTAEGNRFPHFAGAGDQYLNSEQLLSEPVNPPYATKMEDIPAEITVPPRF